MCLFVWLWVGGVKKSELDFSVFWNFMFTNSDYLFVRPACVVTLPISPVFVYCGVCFYYVSCVFVFMWNDFNLLCVCVFFVLVGLTGA